jgi:hypothetical protein
MLILKKIIPNQTAPCSGQPYGKRVYSNEFPAMLALSVSECIEPIQIIDFHSE